MKGFFCLHHHHVQTSSDRQAASYPMDTRALSTGIKWLEHEADHSPPSSNKVKNAWSYISIPLMHLHGVVLNQAGMYLHDMVFKHKDFTFTFIYKILKFYVTQDCL
jgi:hypothetical protein